MTKNKVVTLEDRIPKLKEQRKQKANRRLIIYLSFFFILIIFIIYFQSPLSKVSAIQVIGNERVSEEEVIELSTIDNSTSYWRVNEKEVSVAIKSHPEIKGVILKKKLPNTVEIIVEEHLRIAYIFDDGDYRPVLDNGKILIPQPDSTIPHDAPIMFYWKKHELLVSFIDELLKLPESVIYAISEIHHTPVENNNHLLTLYMNDGFEVRANIRDFSNKLKSYPSIVSQLDPSQKGVINLEVGAFFKPYETIGSEDEEDGVELDDESEG
ncbi:MULTISPECIES: cell division protein FtsQ/DivIB [Bacillus]|uniref:cell division protein FtsQ/DivIB n=1 Tax=Bacillus TaxID=1386 RepID=UPI000BB80AC2|nr:MULTISPECIES: FtsQ-type POTRA domain-containing protein [Bacillus]